MKVTALIPDGLMHEVKALTHAKTLTESLLIAMQEWVSLQKLRALNQKVKKSPLQFHDDFSANKVRELNYFGVTASLKIKADKVVLPVPLKPKTQHNRLTQMPA